MIKNLKCTNLAKSKVKKPVEFNPGTQIFLSRVRRAIDYAIEELNAGYKMLRLMNCSKWLNTHRTMDYWLFIRGSRANSYSILSGMCNIAQNDDMCITVLPWYYNVIPSQGMTLTFSCSCHSDEGSKISLAPNDNQLVRAIHSYIILLNFVKLY